MHHFVLILWTMMGGVTVQRQESAVFEDFDTCQRVADSLVRIDWEHDIRSRPYCMRRPGPIPSKLP